MTRTTNQDWNRLQKYLSVDTYEEVQYALPDKREAMCIDHLNQLLRAVLTYVPRHVALELLQEPVVAENKGRFLEGTLLFADISGFTNLSEKLREIGGKAGAEQVTRVINGYLDVMLGILFRYNGLLIKFGGDAMLCLFADLLTDKDTVNGQVAMKALWAAWEMRQAMMEQFGAIEVFQEVFPLSMKVGSNSGLLFAANVGTPEHMEYVLTGSVVERTAHAESAANSGDVLISRETYELVKGRLEAEALEERPGFYKVTDIHHMPIIEGEEQWSEIEKQLSILKNDLWGLVDRLDSLTPYLPTGTLPLLVNDPKHGQVEGQHRQVTIVFANFIRMSEIIQARGTGDEEGITADLGEYFRAVQEEVQYYGGVINKVDLYDQGDKLIVMFGAPVAHEQDTQRAALTALAMQETMSRLSSPITSTLLSQRIGVHTGFVFAGNVGSSECNRREYTVMGDTVNLAARLMSAAPPGQVWVSQHVWDQIQGGFEAEALSPIKVKGISEPVPVYQLQAAKRVLKDRDWSRILHSELVGRDAELEMLNECFDNLLFGEGKQIIAITGEAGVGKSRLITEWQQRAVADTNIEVATRLNGCGHSYGRRTYGVFIEVLEQFLAFADDDTQEEQWSKLSKCVIEIFADRETGWFDEFSNKLAYLGQFLALDLSKKSGLTERVAHVEGEILQVQIRLTICDLLEHAARERPLILILEDLHWADDASLELLQFLVDRISDASSIMFCLLYRSQKEYKISQTWHDIERSHPDCRSIFLQELRAVDGYQLLFNLLRTSQLPEDFQALVLRETDGNPLYIEEVLHTLIGDGVLVQDKDEWRLVQSVEHIRVPDTLYQIIQSRIDDLDFGSPGARRVLWMASVIGDEFAEDLLLHLFTTSGRKKEEFLRHFRELRNAAMVERAKIAREDRLQRGYRFRHGLVQQVAYENISVAKRCEYHCEVGHWLEDRYRESLQRHYDTLAYHYDRGEQWDKAAHYHRLAGAHHKRDYANREAAVHLQRALEIGNRYILLDEKTLLQLNGELGQVLAIMGQYDEALAHFTQALRLLEDKEQDETQLHRARIHCHVGRVYERRGLLDEALDWQRRGLTLLPSEPTAEGAQLHALGSAIGYHKPDHTLLKEEAEKTLALAQQVDAQSAMAQAHNLLSIYYRNIGDLTQAAEHCHYAAVEYDKLADLIGMGRASLNLGVIAFEQGEWSKAEDAFQRARKGLEQANESYLLAITYSNLGNLYCHLGNLDQAFIYVQQGLKGFVAQNSHQGVVFAHTVLATVFWRQGKLEQARAALEEARALMETHGVRGFEPTVGRWMAQVYLTEGDISQAEAEIQPLLSMDTDVLDVELEPIQRLRGQSLAARGNLIEAVQVLQSVLERLEQKQARYEIARTLLALTDVTAQMKDGATNARAHAERAQAIFADLGAKWDVQEVNKLLDSL